MSEWPSSKARHVLSALLAINLHPGETVQPWHTDDGGARIPRPRPPLGISTFWQGTFVGSFIVVAALFDRLRSRNAND